MYGCMYVSLCPCVTLTEFCNTVTGNTLVGMELRNSLKSSWITVSAKARQEQDNIKQANKKLLHNGFTCSTQSVNKVEAGTKQVSMNKKEQ